MFFHDFFLLDTDVLFLFLGHIGKVKARAFWLGDVAIEGISVNIIADECITFSFNVLDEVASSPVMALPFEKASASTASPVSVGWRNDNG